MCPLQQVVQAIGASESALDFSQPKKIDGDAAVSLVEAAAEVGVQQYVMVSSLGTGKFGLPAGAPAHADMGGEVCGGDSTSASWLLSASPMSVL